jgi:crotonobetainyl-CoA:carnitine CoA-transferase CaiB-like acyl-CoA transferase
VVARLSSTPGEIAYAGRHLGADTDEILGGELGIPDERLDALRARGVVG